MLYSGFSPRIKKFISETSITQTQPPYIKNGEYLVNFSFDLELSYSTYFWQKKYELARQVGVLARSNLQEITSLLSRNKIPHNVQILSILLDPRAQHYPKLNVTQLQHIIDNPDLFMLRADDITLLNNEYTQVGIHGYSHRLFTDLSEVEARDEITRAKTIHREFFPNHEKIFMSFPRNKVAHTNILQELSIDSWRTDHNFPKTQHEVPLGHWFSPGNISASDLKKMLKHIKLHQEGFLLHLWGHYTEMDFCTFNQYLEVINEAGWKYTDTKSLATPAD